MALSAKVRQDRYRSTEKGRATRKRCMQDWFGENREKRNAYMRAWNAKNRERVLPRKRAARMANPLPALVNAARERARTKGIPFDITVADLHLPGMCPVLGIPIFVGDKTHSANSPTLDRIDNSKGYVKGNVIVVSYRANSLKSDATLDELHAIIRFYSPLLERKAA